MYLLLQRKGNNSSMQELGSSVNAACKLTSHMYIEAHYMYLFLEIF